MQIANDSANRNYSAAFVVEPQGLSSFAVLCRYTHTAMHYDALQSVASYRGIAIYVLAKSQEIHLAKGQRFSQRFNSD